MVKTVRNDTVVALLLLLFLIGLTFYLAFHAHPSGDDYCHAIYWKKGADWYEYSLSSWNNWTGRWASGIARYVYYDVVGLGANHYWIVTLVGLLSILFGYYLGSTLVYGRHSVALTWGIWSTVIFVALASAIDALLFWLTGLTDYTFGYFFVPLSLWLAAKVLHQKRFHIWSVLATGICLFWSCGFSELFLIPITCFLVGSFFLSGQKLRTVILGSFALAGTLINIFAPGNLQRHRTSNLDIDFNEIVAGALFYGFRGLILPVLALTVLSSLPFSAAVVKQLVSHVEQRLNNRLIFLIAGFALLYPFAIEFVLFWNLGAPGPGRAHNISLFTLIVLWPVILAAVRLRFSTLLFTLPKYGKAIVQIGAIVLLFAVNPLNMARDILSGKSYRHHQVVSNAEFDLRLPENLGKDVVLPTSDLVTTDASHWLNKCLAEYFSIKTVKAASPEKTQ